MPVSVVTAGHTVGTAGTEWGAVLPRLGFLALLAAVMAGLATRAFRTYQKSA